MQIKHTEKEFVKIWKINSLGDYYDSHVRNDTLLLADIFKNFQNLCLKIYELDPVRFLMY